MSAPAFLYMLHSNFQHLSYMIICQFIVHLFSVSFLQALADRM